MGEWKKVNEVDPGNGAGARKDTRSSLSRRNGTNNKCIKYLLERLHLAAQAVTFSSNAHFFGLSLLLTYGMFLASKAAASEFKSMSNWSQPKWLSISLSTPQ